MFLGCFIIKKNFCWFVFHLALSFEPFIFSYQYNVRRRKQPEAVESSEERRIRELPTRHGQGNNQQQASRWKRVKTSTVRNRADGIVTIGTNKAFLTLY